MVMLHWIPVIASTITSDCSDPFVSVLNGGLKMIIAILMGLGVAVSVIGIIVGGLMRATAWGSEQRIAMSNKAISSAVIGLVIVLLGITLGSQIPVWFGQKRCLYNYFIRKGVSNRDSNQGLKQEACLLVHSRGNQ